MQFGITVFTTDRSIAIPDLATAAEERGFHSLFVPEHTHIPTSRKTPPPTGHAELAEEYRRTLDPFVALAAASTATSRLRLGTGICLVAQREPLVTAKAIATLDLLSGGRVDLGIGYGWNVDEMENHGVDPATRWARLREHVLAMKALWNDEVASFAGAFVRFSESWSWPKPVQGGGPPILIGGAARPRLLAHVAEFGDGWMPVGSHGLDEAIPMLHRACEGLGRDPGTVRIIPFGATPEPERLARLCALGIQEVVLHVRSGPRDQVLANLDRVAGVIEQFDRG